MTTSLFFSTEFTAFYGHNQERTAHFKNLKEKIKQLYQQQSAYYLLHLPLEYDAFLVLKTSYNSFCQQQMLKAYQNHSLHTLWRLLHPDEDWSIPKENKLGKQLEPYQWLIILMWLAASDDLFIPSEQSVIQNLEQRIKFFFESLSLISKPENLLIHLFQSVVAHPFTQILNIEILHLEQERFIQKNLIARLKSLEQSSIQYLMDIIKHKKLQTDTHAFELLTLDETQIQIFSDEMQQKWGRQWTLNKKMQTLSLELLSYPNYIEQHEKIIINSLKELFPQGQHPQSFFYNNTIKSTNPKTNEFALPLS